MNRYGIQIKQRLDKVKPAEGIRDTLICPASLSNAIALFLDDYEIEYTHIENPQLYPKDEIQERLAAYQKHVYFPDDSCKTDAFITPFDADALFKWSLQLFGDNKDPAYQEYLDERDREAEQYYQDVYLPQYQEQPPGHPDAEESIAGSSYFDDDEDMRDQIRRCMQEHGNLERTARWLLSDCGDELTLIYKNPKDGPDAGSGLSLDPKTKKLAEYITKTMILRLAKDEGFPNGFAIVTAFPWINADSTPTGMVL